MSDVVYSDHHPYVIGTNYLIRTVTMIYTGKLIAVYAGELLIENAAWIAETERWADSVANGVFREVEPYPDDKGVIINRGAIVDAVRVNWPLPRTQK